MTTNDLAIDLKGVDKMYRGKVHALCGVDLQVHPGEIFGLLGPNGAGKSTLVKIMMTVVRPTRATGTVLGAPVGHKATLGRVGYLPEHHRMPGYLTGRQVLDYFAALARVPSAKRKERATTLLERVGMTEAADRRITGYSKGMLQRVGLAQAMMNDPDLIVLDEPTDGVDPVGRRDIRDILVEMKGAGKTVFVNSHLLSELEMVCDRVAILSEGSLVRQGTISELTTESQRYEVRIAGAAPEWAFPEPNMRVTPASDTTLLAVMTTDPEAIQPLLDRLRREERVIVSVHAVRDSLEELFMQTVADAEQKSGKGAA